VSPQTSALAIAPGSPSAEAHDCLDCPAAFPTFGAMAEHRWLAHDVPVPDTYAEVGRELPRGPGRTREPGTSLTCRRGCGRSAFTSSYSRGQHERRCPGPDHAETPAEKPEEGMTTMARPCGNCGKVGHGRKDCPTKPRGDGPARREKAGETRKGHAKATTKALAGTVAHVATTAGAPFAVAIEQLAQAAAAYDAKAQQAREAIEVLRRVR
jgi:hypothetical protein